VTTVAFWYLGHIVSSTPTLIQGCCTCTRFLQRGITRLMLLLLNTHITLVAVSITFWLFWGLSQGGVELTLIIIESLQSSNNSENLMSFLLGLQWDDEFTLMNVQYSKLVNDQGIQY
jgi:hypothetical protein